MARYIQNVTAHCVEALLPLPDYKTYSAVECQLVAHEKVVSCMVSVIKDFRSSRPAEELGREIAEHG